MKKSSVISAAAMLVLGIAYYICALRYTIYSLGVYAVPIVWLVSANIAFVAMLKNRWKGHWWAIFNSTNAVFFAGLLVVIAVDRYKPTYVIHIPENFEGEVSLFPAKEKSDELFVDENGMGYYNPRQDVEVKLLQGDEDISNALNQYGRGALQFPVGDSTHYEAIDFTCFRVEKGKIYGSSPWNQPRAACMVEAEFKRLVAEGIIDESRIEKRIMPYLKNN